MGDQEGKTWSTRQWWNLGGELGRGEKKEKGTHNRVAKKGQRDKIQGGKEERRRIAFRKNKGEDLPDWGFPTDGKTKILGNGCR